MSLIKELLSEHGGELAGVLKSQLGLDADQAQGAIESVAPLVLNGLKSQQEAGGADALSGILSSLGSSESLLGNLGGLSSLLGGSQQGGNPLEALLGGSSAGGAATNALSKKLGIGGDKAGSIMTMLIPVIFAFIQKKGREDTKTPDQLTGISAILDRDGDGSALDDIAGMVLNSKGGGGGLGSIIGSLLGRR